MHDADLRRPRAASQGMLSSGGAPADPARRRLLAGAGAAAVAALPGAALAWQPAPAYPDPAVQVLDPAFEPYRLFNAGVERIATGMRWAEGPVWFGDGRFLLWSDIPNNRIMKWEEETGAVSEFRKPSNYANGNTRDRQGRLVTCEHLTRRVTRTEYDGSVTVLMDNYQGKPLNSPNDVVCHTDGSIWFSDPPFGIGGNYEGRKARAELPHTVYRIDAATGKGEAMITDLKGANGLCFSPDRSLLYVVEGRAAPNRLIHAYDVADGGARLSNRRVFLDAQGGTIDGMRCDIDGNLWCGWGMGEGKDGVMVVSPQGKRLGHIHLPERCANLCFGGPQRNRLFMASSHSIYALYVNTQGVAGG
ncbi:SMP-30/gluconolactonase/LRE family protein [Bordetella petrii]|uniref:SMP-30/gluconolactonase/LRE family protein n=1 Tax=Bordetella petrii TaxID=94624 RepID=UPI001A965958|nr:SMP-30/gluconolactonase/LRE family protein [Bordetella petrii]MBO1113100.1 SMP-30/gluconolactonase/LRE family protein [Bordetella petrii]